MVVVRDGGAGGLARYPQTIEGNAPQSPGVVDRRRVRSYAGLVIGRLGPRAYGAVSGVFLTLLVGNVTKSLFAVTFALTAGRLFTWAAYPVIGRLSDAADTRVGRRTPFMAAGLAVLAVCTFLYPVVHGYWTLVALIAIARVGRVTHGLPSAVATPEIFGVSRWVRALLNVSVLGLIVGLSIRGTVIATWKENDPSTWRPVYWAAAAYIAFAALAILLFVREAPASREVARKAAAAPWRERIEQVLAIPNARPMFAAGLLAIAAGGFTERAFPIYAKQVLHAGGRELALAPLVGGPLGLIVSLPIGIWLAHRFDRRTVAVVAAIAGAAYSFSHVFFTNIWQSVGAGVVAGPFGVAVAIALAPLALQLVPRSGGIAERIGLFAGPVAAVGLFANYSAGLVYDFVTQDYRVIWILAGTFGLAAAVPLLWLKVPQDARRADLRAAVRYAREMFAARTTTSEERGLFRGTVTGADTDTVALLEALQERLDPYREFERPDVATLAEAAFGEEVRDLEA